MKTKEERIKKNRIIAIAFLIALVARDLYKARIIYSQELVNQKQDVK